MEVEGDRSVGGRGKNETCQLYKDRGVVSLIRKVLKHGGNLRVSKRLGQGQSSETWKRVT